MCKRFPPFTPRHRGTYTIISRRRDVDREEGRKVRKLKTGETRRKRSKGRKVGGDPREPSAVSLPVALPSSLPVGLEAARRRRSHSGPGVPWLQLGLGLGLFSHGQPAWSFRVSEKLHEISGCPC